MPTMPELPEVENVRRTLAEHLVGRRIGGVAIHRPDVITGDRLPGSLLTGQRVIDVARHGKQLAIVGEDARAVCVHLGMTGRLTVTTSAQPPVAHTHVVWALENDAQARFVDPRRFGGLWTFSSLDQLWGERWQRLGDDALVIQPRKLHRLLSRTRRTVKAALLDQSVVAGLGNIYVDELLFICRLHPTRVANTLPPEAMRRLIRNMRALLHRAIKAGGSTLRDYADANGAAGAYQLRHRVYGRGGQPCVRCESSLETLFVAGRTTAACKLCQL